MSAMGRAWVVRMASSLSVKDRLRLARQCSLSLQQTGNMASVAVPDCTNKALIVPKEEVVRFIRDCMQKAGATCNDADEVARHLMTADYRGHFSHGMNRLQLYVNDIRKKLTDASAKPKILSDFQVGIFHA